MRKKLFVTLLMALVLLSGLAASSASTAPAATVNLIRNKVITNADLNSAVQDYAGTGLTPVQVLDILINDEVFLQGAERAGIVVTDTQLESLYASQKTQIEAQLGRQITQQQFEAEVVSQYGSVDNFKEILKNQYILQAYLMQAKGDELNNRDYTPSDSDIRAFYRKNQTTFVMAENVKFSQIFKEFTGDASLDSYNEGVMKGVASDIKSGKVTFEAAVAQYTDDEDAKIVGGETGWLAANNDSARQVFGDNFVDSVIECPVGSITDVITSNVGYHIVKVTVHNDAKMLGINDRIQPDQSLTVYQYIQSGLQQQNMQIAMNNALDELIGSLRSEARIRILYK